jgi:hypothetical protein
MAGYWPTQGAREDDPVIAELMNTMPKMVVSTTLASADWHNTTVVGANVAEELAKRKQQPGKDLAVLGSPTLTLRLIEGMSKPMTIPDRCACLFIIPSSCCCPSAGCACHAGTRAVP